MDPVTAFVFFGDSGTGEAAQREVAAAITAWCGTHRCDFALLLGDAVYPGGVEDADDPQLTTKFATPYRDTELVYHVALGNHDHLGSVAGLLAYDNPQWSLPARWTTLRAGPAAIHLIDTTHFGPRQARWLDAALAHRAAPWVIVAGHHPLPVHGRFGGTPPLDRTLGPLLARADLYLAAHEHNLQVHDLAPPMVVVGGGGARLTAPVTGPDTAFAAKDYGFGWLELRPDTATLVIVGRDGAVRYQRVYTHPWDGRVHEGPPQKGPP